MPVLDAKIRVNSNLLREPQVFEQLGPLAGALARDIMIFACMKKEYNLVLHLPEFCQVMGYNRQHLLRPIGEKYVKQLREDGFAEEDLPDLSNTICYTICRMLKVNLIFAPKYEHPQKPQGEKPKYKQRERRYDKKSLLAQVRTLHKRSTGTMIGFVVDPEIIADLKDLYQTIDRDEYLSLRTPGGHADDQARRVYCRLIWKRQYWDSKQAERGIYPSTDSYRELLVIAGLDKYKPAKRAASLLRKLLTRIGQMPSIQMRPTLEMDYSKGVYSVSWARILTRAQIKEEKEKKLAAIVAAKQMAA